jgi:hypothetical protein
MFIVISCRVLRLSGVAVAGGGCWLMPLSDVGFRLLVVDSLCGLVVVAQIFLVVPSFFLYLLLYVLSETVVHHKTLQREHSCLIKMAKVRTLFFMTTVKPPSVKQKKFDPPTPSTPRLGKVRDATPLN